MGWGGGGGWGCGGGWGVGVWWGWVGGGGGGGVCVGGMEGGGAPPLNPPLIKLMNNSGWSLWQRTVQRVLLH